MKPEGSEFPAGNTAGEYSPEAGVNLYPEQAYYNTGDGIYATYSTNPTVAAAADPDGGSAMSNTPETELRQTLRERHVSMIGFSLTLGVGLFLSSGKIISIAGPGLAVIAYILMGTLMWSTMATLGEMTALFPVKGPTFEFARRFLDESIGLSSAWMLWFSYIVIVAAEILAITAIFQFRVPPSYLASVGYPAATMQWDFGLSTDPSVWVGIFLVVVLVVNLLPVRQYGQLEYTFGCIKITLLITLILINTVLNARKAFHDNRFWTYDSPYSFGSANFTVIPPNTTAVDDPGVVLTGSSGTFVSLWTACYSSFYSLMGWEIILLTAPENRDLAREETIKISSRKIALRILLLYALAVFTVGLNVPYTDPQLKAGQSIFVLAAIREHVVGLPQFLQGFFVFSACATAINALYSASRLLHAAASLRDAWPAWGWAESIRSRLERTNYGVPINAVFVSWLVGFLAFLSVQTDSAEILNRMESVATSAYLIVYAINCGTFLVFFKEIGRAATGTKDDELHLTPEMRVLYKRSSKQYPYRSHLQWLRALYGLCFCILMVLFAGWRTFVRPMAVADFVATYISIPIFIVLSAAFFFKSRGFRPRNWHLRASKLAGLEAVGPVVVRAKDRRGRLMLDKREGIWGKVKAFGEWVWVWLK